ncbi:MAG: glycosyltransferase family 2 protein [Candidatus Hodarchaeota archaeon]
MAQTVSFSRYFFAVICQLIAYLITAFTALYLPISLGLLVLQNDPLIFSINLFILLGEAVGLLFTIYLFFILASALKTPHNSAPADFPLPNPAPIVTVILPVFNEPIEILQPTLEAVIKLDYPQDRLEVIVVDDSIQPDLVVETKKLCETLGVNHQHRDNRAGFKAGAINSILENTKGAFLLILDADQIPFPHLLQSTIPLFADEKVALAQAKLSFRNMDCSTRACAGLIHSEFYEVIEKAKDKRGTVTFPGTTGVFRKSALLEIGGFSDETLVEDFDTTVKLFSHGYRAHLADTYGSIGLTPWHFSSHVAQLWRWAQGTTAVFRKRVGLILRSDLPRSDKLDVLLTALVTPASTSVLLLAIMLGIMVLFDVPMIRFGGSSHLYLIMPTFLLLGHLLSAALAISWGKEEGVPRHSFWEIIPFYIFTIMILPFLISAVISGLRGKNCTFQRTEKQISGNQSNVKNPGPITFQRVVLYSLLSFILGFFLIGTGLLALLNGNILFGWLLAVGLCCLLPVPLLLNDFRVHGARKVAITT